MKFNMETALNAAIGCAIVLVLFSFFHVDEKIKKTAANFETE